MKNYASKLFIISIFLILGIFFILKVRPLAPLPFPWIKSGNEMIFDLKIIKHGQLTPQGGPLIDTENAYKLSISEDLKILGSSLKFYDFKTPKNTIIKKINVPQWASFGPSNITIERLQRTKDGLAISRPIVCDGNWFGKRFTSTLIPAKPKIEEIYHSYVCKGKIRRSFKVVGVSEKVQTKIGTFTTFVLENERGSITRRVFWNEKEGIIKIEMYQSMKNKGMEMLGYYELASKNF